jgi:hypothetical protein
VTEDVPEQPTDDEPGDGEEAVTVVIRLIEDEDELDRGVGERDPGRRL